MAQLAEHCTGIAEIFLSFNLLLIYMTALIIHVFTYINTVIECYVMSCHIGDDVV